VAVLTVLAPPSITSSPQSQTVIVGSNALFLASAVGTLPLSYQWRVGAIPIAGATDITYTRTNVHCPDAGSYDLVVTNYLGSATSSVAVLTVVSPPSISNQPSNQTVLVGHPLTLTVGATNECGGLAYQWLMQGTNLAGATTSTYSVGNAQVSNAGSYTVIVSNLAASVTSVVATVTVLTPPSVDFTASPLSGFAPLTVYFTNLTTGASGYSWTFGNSSTSTNLNPVTTYLNAGSYTVTLQAFGPGGTNSVTKAGFITVTNIAPPVIVVGPHDSTNFVFSFLTVSGKLYVIQYKNILTDPAWQTLSSVPGDGTVQTITNSVTTPSQRFYRLSVQ
jgi:PKD repeat protein